VPEAVSNIFLVHGPLGVMALVAGWIAWRMYKDNAKLREDHNERLVKLTEDHKNEMKALEERYITKAETWMAQYHELARAQTSVMDSIERRFQRHMSGKYEARPVTNHDR
jgi:hypothetical protein